jgi:hypothetical protein
MHVAEARSDVRQARERVTLALQMVRIGEQPEDGRSDVGDQGETLADRGDDVAVAASQRLEDDADASRLGLASDQLPGRDDLLVGALASEAALDVPRRPASPDDPFAAKPPRAGEGGAEVVGDPTKLDVLSDDSHRGREQPVEDLRPQRQGRQALERRPCLSVWPVWLKLGDGQLDPVVALLGEASGEAGMGVDTKSWHEVRFGHFRAFLQETCELGAQIHPRRRKYTTIDRTIERETPITIQKP